jgi:hypothetical protein
MVKKILLSMLFACSCLWSFADNAVKQVVQIDGQTQTEEVESLTFSGDEVTITFRDGQSTVAKLHSVTISFTGTTTAIKKVVEDKSQKSEAYYTLSGIKTKPVSKGVYIHNGKKIIKTK